MILSIITIITLFNLISLLRHKKPLRYTYCGLAGFNGANPPNINKLQILGMLNVQRGKHSCGIFMNNQVGYGVDSTKEFQDLIAKMKLPENFENSNNVIIHTRHATMGVHSIENAHPFCYVDSPNDTSYAFAGAHNGKVSNWKEILDEFDIDDNDFKVDSDALLFTIFSQQNFKALSKYKGAAALLFTWTKEPNTLYAFRGAAGNNEERPLYYVKAKEGVYFSSLINSLNIIENHNSEVFEVPANTVLKFKEGKIIGQYKLSRPEDLHESYKPPVVYNINNYNNNNNLFNQNNNHNVNNNSSVQTTVIQPINYNLESINRYKALVKNGNEEYWINAGWKFKYHRYYRNGHLAEGKFMLSVLTNNPKDADKEIYMGRGIIFYTLDQAMAISKDYKDTKAEKFFHHTKSFAYPFPDVSYNPDTKEPVRIAEYYFKDGTASITEEIIYPGVDLIYQFVNGKLSNVKSLKELTVDEDSEFIETPSLCVETVECIAVNISDQLETEIDEVYASIAFSHTSEDGNAAIDLIIELELIKSTLDDLIIKSKNLQSKMLLNENSN